MEGIVTPCAHVQQGVKQLVLSIISTEITRSGDLSIWAIPKHNIISVKIIDKLASFCFESFWQSLWASQTLRCYWPHLSTAPTTGHLLSVHVHNLQVRSSVGSCMRMLLQLYESRLCANKCRMQMQRAGYVLYRALVRLLWCAARLLHQHLRSSMVHFIASLEMH